MAIKQKRITCARCGERETVLKGERGPASIYCDLCRDEVKREQNAVTFRDKWRKFFCDIWRDAGPFSEPPNLL